jgi:hypothetical protein
MARQIPSPGGADLLAAAVVLVDGRPGAPFGFVLWRASAFIALRDILGFALLLVGVLRLVSADP